VSFPWSILSDKIGRKPMLLLSFCSIVMGGIWSMAVLTRWDIFPIRLLLISPFFAFFGGGVSVLTAVIHSIIADVATDKYGNRSLLCTFTTPS
jgi:MFS family permease